MDDLVGPLEIPIHQFTGNLFEFHSASALDHLDNVQIGPGKVARTSRTTGVQVRVEGSENRLRIRRKTIYRNEYRLGRP